MAKTKSIFAEKKVTKINRGDSGENKKTVTRKTNKDKTVPEKTSKEKFEELILETEEKSEEIAYETEKTINQEEISLPMAYDNLQEGKKENPETLKLPVLNKFFKPLEISGIIETPYLDKYGNKKYYILLPEATQIGYEEKQDSNGLNILVYKGTQIELNYYVNLLQADIIKLKTIYKQK